MEGVESMDKKEAPAFSWMTAAMPRVAAQVAEKRKQWGNAHVTDCVKRGLRGEAGYFFAREGAVAVGTPWDQPEMANFAAQHIKSGQSIVVMKMPEVGNGSA